MRLFVALELPPDIRAGLSALAGGIPGARWVAAENMHVTLRFVGDADGGAFRDLMDGLEEVRGAPFDLSLAGIGHFETARRPRALWVGVEPSRPLMQLQAAVETAVQRAGFLPDGRRYMPHVTLARLKDAPAGRVRDFIAEHNLFRSRAFAVAGFTLFSSHLSRSGAIYRAEAEYPFARAANDDASPPEPVYDPWGVTES